MKHEAVKEARDTAVVSLVREFKKIGRPDAIDVLVDMLKDNIVAGHAAIALGKLKAKRAIPALETLLDHPKDWVRKQAERAIRKAGR